MGKGMKHLGPAIPPFRQCYSLSVTLEPQIYSFSLNFTIMCYALYSKT